MTLIVTSRAPVRIDFGGAWTDVNIFSHAAGGVVLNATIDKYVTGKIQIREGGEEAQAREGIGVSYGFDLPSGSGLGTSAALNVVWLSLIKSQITSGEQRKQIAELAYQLEEMLGILGGKQDQYAAAMGGFNLMRFGADGVTVEPLAVPRETVRELESRSVLCYTGKPRLSGTIHENVWGAFRQGRPATVGALYAMRDLALRMAPALSSGDIDAFADLLADNWQSQQALDPSVTNAQIEDLFETAIRAGARGGKACGAGGGGCLYFVTRPGRREAVAEALAGAGARLIDFAFEFDGLAVQTENQPE
jgi:D-glycero-alpha-D-manno-heptose-7-phosphate kinase